MLPSQHLQCQTSKKLKSVVDTMFCYLSDYFVVPYYWDVQNKDTKRTLYILTGTPWPLPTLLFPWTRQTFMGMCTSTVSCQLWWRYQPTFCHGLCFAGVPDGWLCPHRCPWEGCFCYSFSLFQHVWHLNVLFKTDLL